MKNIFILTITFVVSILSYGQNIKKIKIEHIGENDKPFYNFEIADQFNVNFYDFNMMIQTINDSAVYSKVIDYFHGNYLGSSDSLNTNFGTFSITFVNNNKTSYLIINREGAVCFFSNLYTYLSIYKKERDLVRVNLNMLL